MLVRVPFKILLIVYMFFLLVDSKSKRPLPQQLIAEEGTCDLSCQVSAKRWITFSSMTMKKRRQCLQNLWSPKDLELVKTTYHLEADIWRCEHGSEISRKMMDILCMSSWGPTWMDDGRLHLFCDFVCPTADVFPSGWLHWRHRRSLQLRHGESGGGGSEVSMKHRWPGPNGPNGRPEAKLLIYTSET